MYIAGAVGIIFVLVSAATTTVAVSRTQWTVFATHPTCTEAAQIVCSEDCKEVQVCLGDGHGGFVNTTVATCNETTACSAQEGDCVSAELSECQTGDPGDYTCHGIGAYPDPYDCQKFYMCNTEIGQPTPGSCRGTSAYNPLTGDCSLTTSDRVCTEGPIEQCKKVGQIGVVPENHAIYYICTRKGDELVPEMYRCPGSQIYDLTTAQCVESSSSSSTSAPSSNSSPSTSNSTTTTTPSTTTTSSTTPSSTASPSTSSPVSPPPSEGGSCTNHLEIAVDPLDCTSYYVCVSVVWVHVQCIDGYYFDTQEQICVEGVC